ncbi:hypothetical protein [Methylococcus sp. EFPC2]|uniref:hypothetical protein n=1 Tax=Methylococcus sp. EFPC2 TaxID=2812648 RepID=UPI0019685EDF|nr:hypothetical protein [Methylococcus sp. EFPC2]QSA96222.1 hypothetical protein JWZ97_13425 [Methylococcus sp. EFPC2]
MIGVIATLLVVFWFYQTAQQRQLPSLQWMIGGALVYYLGFAAAMYLAIRPLMGPAFKNHGFWLGLSFDIGSALVGLLLASLFRSKIMLKQGQIPPESGT